MVDVEGVAGGRIEEALDARATCGTVNRRRSPTAARRRARRTQISRMPAMKNSAPHTSAISMVWPKSGCSTSRDRQQQQRERDGVGRHFRPARGFGEQPGDQDHEAGLEEFRRLHVDAEQDDPAPRALDLGAELERGGHQDQAEHEHQQREAPDVARRQERGWTSIDDRRDQIEHVPDLKVERLEPEPRGDRRAGGERERCRPASARAAPAAARSTVHHHSPQGRALSARDHGSPRLGPDFFCW